MIQGKAQEWQTTADKPHRSVKALLGLLLIQNNIPDGQIIESQVSSISSVRCSDSDLGWDFFI